MPLPPPPTNDASGSFAWLEWFRQLRNYITQTGSVPWSIIGFTGSKITDIVSRSHQNLQAILGGTTGEYYHLRQAKYNEIISPVVTVTGATYTVGSSYLLVVNYAGTCTITLPVASSNTDIKLKIKTITANTVVSASSNVIPLTGGAAGTAILAATAGKWVELASDGTNWVIMAGN